MHRLPVQRSSRVPPDGVMSYGEWQVQFGRHYLNKYQQPRQKFKERAERLLKAQEREAQAEGDMAEVAEAFSAAFPLCRSGIFENPTALEMESEAQRPKHPKQKQRSQSLWRMRSSLIPSLRKMLTASVAGRRRRLPFDFSPQTSRHVRPCCDFYGYRVCSTCFRAKS